MFRIERFSCVFFLTLFAAPAVWALPENPCAGAAAAELGATVRDAAWAGENHYRLEVEAPGVVTLELGNVAAGARLALLSFECERITAGNDGAVILEESPEHLAFAVVRPGTFFLRVGAADSFKLSTSFVEAEAREEEMVFRRSTSAGRAVVTTLSVPELVTKDDEHEVDPDPFLAEPGRKSLLTVIDFSGAAELKDDGSGFPPRSLQVDGEVDPDPSRTSGAVAFARAALLPDGDEWTALVTFPARALTKDDEHEVDPDPVRSGATAQEGRWVRFASAADGEAIVSWLAEWISSGAVGEGVRVLAGGALSEAPMLRLDLAARCRDDANDDHGDTFACATPIGLGTVAAELENGWGDDEDVFRFRLDEMRSVTIEAAGVSLGLYDRFGQRLATAAGAVVRTLVPGTYFVRVDGAAGAYELTLASSEW